MPLHCSFCLRSKEILFGEKTKNRGDSLIWPVYLYERRAMQNPERARERERLEIPWALAPAGAGWPLARLAGVAHGRGARARVARRGVARGAVALALVPAGALLHHHLDGGGVTPPCTSHERERERRGKRRGSIGNLQPSVVTVSVPFRSTQAQSTP